MIKNFLMYIVVLFLCTNFGVKAEETIIIDDDFSAYNNGSSLSFNSNWGELQNPNALIATNGVVMNRQGLGVGAGWRGVMNVSNAISNVNIGDVIEVSFDYKMYTDSSQNQTFTDLVISPNYADSVIKFGDNGVLGIRISQSQFEDGKLKIESYAGSPSADDIVTPLSNIGIDVGVDNESDWLRISYQATMTAEAGIWSVDISVSNMTTEASYSVEDVEINNLPAYSSVLLVGFYNYASYSNNEGYEIDNLYVSVTTPPTPTEVVTQIINDDFSYSDGLALNWANNWAELNNPNALIATNGVVMNRQGLGIGAGFRGVMNVSNTVSNIDIGDVIEVTYDYKIYTDTSQNQTFVDLLLSPSYEDASIRYDSPGIIGFRSSQTAANNFRIESYAGSPVIDDINTSLSNIGIDVGVDNESDWMRVSYQAFKTENSGIWSVDISVSNMTTEASYSVEDISISNSLAYDATELLVGFFHYTTFAGNEGYEIDNLSVTMTSPYEPPIELSEYQSWLNENSLVDGSADSDNDGMIDFLEYALGKNPSVEDNDDISGVYNGNSIVFSHPKRIGINHGIIYSVQTNNNLRFGNWVDAVVVSPSESAGTISHAFSSENDDNLFIRLKVELSE